MSVVKRSSSSSFFRRLRRPMMKNNAVIPINDPVQKISSTPKSPNQDVSFPVSGGETEEVSAET